MAEGRIEEHSGVHMEPRRDTAFRPPAAASVVRPLTRAPDPRIWPSAQLVFDISALYLASLTAVSVAQLPHESVSYWIAGTAPLATVALMHARKGERLSNSALDTAGQVLAAVSLCAMLTIAVGSIAGVDRPSALALWLWLFGLVYLGAGRLALLWLRRWAVRTGTLATPTLVVGAGVVGRQLAARLAGEPRYALRPVGFLDADPLPRSDRYGSAVVPVLGGPGDLAEAVALTGARRVIVAFSSERDRVLVELVQQCHQLGVEVSLVPRLFESISQRATLDHVGGIPLLSLHPINPRGWQFACKHALDRALAAIALVILSPVMLAIAAGVRLSSRGPALFRQRRVGRDGRVFDLAKFRTMYLTENPHGFDLPTGIAPGGIEGEDRCTPFGRWLRRGSLDELPQLFNVLRGEMSLVGPRPERPEFVDRFVAEICRYHDRHRVKSGITGWAQVHGLRGQTSLEDRVEWDNYYIRNWSLRLDLRIIALTVAEILRFRG
jgi:exopolysaccharide biosynthesis polyprenyl glycosylphosphotransferase